MPITLKASVVSVQVIKEIAMHQEFEPPFQTTLI